MFEESSTDNSPPDATVSRRAKSYSDFYHVVRSQLAKDSKKLKNEHKDPFCGIQYLQDELELDIQFDAYEEDLLDASQEEYMYVMHDPILLLLRY